MAIISFSLSPIQHSLLFILPTDDYPKHACLLHDLRLSFDVGPCEEIHMWASSTFESTRIFTEKDLPSSDRMSSKSMVPAVVSVAEFTWYHKHRYRANTHSRYHPKTTVTAALRRNSIHTIFPGNPHQGNPTKRWNKRYRALLCQSCSNSKGFLCVRWNEKWGVTTTRNPNKGDRLWAVSVDNCECFLDVCKVYRGV